MSESTREIPPLSSDNQSGHRSVRSVCPYCGVGCGMVLETDGVQVVRVMGDKEHPANAGRLCTKGQTSALALTHSGRMDAAFVRRARRHDPVKTPIAEAIVATAQRLREILDQHGPDALSFYVSGQMSIEAQYLITKLAKGYIGTNNIESNSRLCMASAAAGYKLSLGSDAPPGSYEDFDQSDLFLVIGANMADCHPILYLRMMDRVNAGAKLIVVDPRRTTTAEKAHLYLPIKPGTDLAFLNGLLYLLHQGGKTDPAFIAAYTQGWEEMPAFLTDYTPDAVSAITGLSVADLTRAADMIAAAPAFMSCWTMGLNQSTHGTWNTNAICNLHLATGQLCRPGSGPFSLTGQPNAMGGREMGYMGPGLPGQRSVLNPADRAFIEQLWAIPEGSIPTQVGKGTLDMFSRMAAGEIKACWIICTNPVASVPNRNIVIEGLQRAELVIAQDAFLDTETNRYADILLPGALWAEAEGVMINSERNLTLMQQAVNPPGEAMADWELIARVARAMGFAEGFNFASAAEVFEEIRRTYNPATGHDLRGVTHARLRTSPLQWPCANEGAARNPIRYLHPEEGKGTGQGAGKGPALRFATASGKAVFFARPHMAPAEMPDADYPMVLNTGRVQHQWHTLTKTGKIPKLNKLNPGTFVEIHPEDATALGIAANDKVEIRSRRGLAVLPAVITDRVQPGCCFAPIHWNDVYGENLCINAVTSDSIDAISYQPELKIAAVALRRLAAAVDQEKATSEVPLAPDRVTGDGGVAVALEECETCATLIQAFAKRVGVTENLTPDFSADERRYLAGYISGLQASESLLRAVPALPLDAPFEAERLSWVNGLLAGMFSRVMPVTEVATAKDAPAKPAISLLWASQTGNAEMLAEQWAQHLSARGWAVTTQAMNDITLEQLASTPLALFITSTFGDGDAPDNGGDFWHSLADAAAPSLSQLQFALLALGDSNYGQFCGHGKKLFARLQALGARALIDRADCDSDYESLAAEWFAKLCEHLTSFESPASTPPVMSTSPSAPVSAPPANYSKTAPYPARLVINRRLNGSGSAKDVRQFGFALGDSGLHYEAGDALGVWPKNCPDYVVELEQALNLNAAAPVVVDTREKSLHQALLEDYEICRPSLEVLRFIAQRTQSKTLTQLLAADRKQELVDWLYGRQLVDVLYEFPLRADLEEWLPLLKRLQPRMYSIASSSKVFPQEVHLTVSAVRYSRFRDSKKERKGVASTFLADRAEGLDVPIFVQPNKHFHVPDKGDTPLIMVGPGTGVAPFRGFLQERQARGDRGKNWLFFGEQHAASDFYYEDELRQFQRDGLLNELSLAFSRDQASKVYVQDRMRERGQEIWNWLEEGAYFCVCGDASRMAKDVDQALRDIIRQYGKFDEAETVNYIRKLNMDKRYLRDVY